MITWALIIFTLSLVFFLLNLFNIFTSFAPWSWSIILFIIALGMLWRIRSKEMEGEKTAGCTGRCSFRSQGRDGCQGIQAIRGDKERLYEWKRGGD